MPPNYLEQQSSGYWRTNSGFRHRRCSRNTASSRATVVHPNSATHVTSGIEKPVPRRESGSSTTSLSTYRIKSGSKRHRFFACFSARPSIQIPVTETNQKTDIPEATGLTQSDLVRELS